MLIHPNVNPMKKMTIASNKHGYVVMEPLFRNSTVGLTAVSHDGTSSTATHFVYCRNLEAIVDKATRLLGIIR